jgi:transcriptional regulator with XRE-family HTH domain
MRQELADEPVALAPHVELRVLIATTGVKQYEVAQRAGLSESVLSRILSGRKPASDELLATIRAAVVAS